MTRVTDQAARQAVLRGWLDNRLPQETRAHLSGVVERDDGTLVIFTDSAAWSARVRYVLPEIEGDLRLAHPEIGRIAVRVLPR